MTITQHTQSEVTALAAREWTTAKPTKPGIYRVRGYSIGRPDRSAVVTVAKHRKVLRCNLHERNSDDDPCEWSRLADLSDRFEWQAIEPRPSAEGEG